jgi:hypothetical protein
LWARHRRDAEDAARAWGIAEARLESKHWDEARRVAEKRLRESAHPGVGLGTVGEEAMKRSYRLVCARLANAGRYYSPLKRPAWVHDVVLAQRRLAAEIG